MQQDFEGLKVWQLAMKFAKEIYRSTEKFPQSEQYGLTGQLRRAAVSIPSNIAEGKGRNHKKEYLQFLYMSRGSVWECITLIKLSEELGYLPQDRTTILLGNCAEITAMLNGLIRSIH